MGPSGVGKTAAVDAASARVGTIPNAWWFHTKTGTMITYKGLVALWNNPVIPLLVLEGSNVHDVVFQCATLASLQRGLWIATLSKTVEDENARVKNGGLSYSTALVDFTKSFQLVSKKPYTLLESIQEFWAERDYSGLKHVARWLDRAVALPGVV